MTKTINFSILIFKSLLVFAFVMAMLVGVGRESGVFALSIGDHDGDCDRWIDIGTSYSFALGDYTLIDGVRHRQFGDVMVPVGTNVRVAGCWNTRFGINNDRFGLLAYHNHRWTVVFWRTGNEVGDRICNFLGGRSDKDVAAGYYVRVYWQTGSSTVSSNHQIDCWFRPEQIDSDIYAGCIGECVTIAVASRNSGFNSQGPPYRTSTHNFYEVFGGSTFGRPTDRHDVCHGNNRMCVHEVMSRSELCRRTYPEGMSGTFVSAGSLTAASARGNAYSVVLNRHGSSSTSWLAIGTGESHMSHVCRVGADMHARIVGTNLNQSCFGICVSCRGDIGVGSNNGNQCTAPPFIIDGVRYVHVYAPNFGGDAGSAGTRSFFAVNSGNCNIVRENSWCVDMGGLQRHTFCTQVLGGRTSPYTGFIPFNSDLSPYNTSDTPQWARDVLYDFGTFTCYVPNQCGADRTYSKCVPTQYANAFGFAAASLPGLSCPSGQTCVSTVGLRCSTAYGFRYLSDPARLRDEMRILACRLDPPAADRLDFFAGAGCADADAHCAWRENIPCDEYMGREVSGRPVSGFECVNLTNSAGRLGSPETFQPFLGLDVTMSIANCESDQICVGIEEDTYCQNLRGRLTLRGLQISSSPIMTAMLTGLATGDVRANRTTNLFNLNFGNNAFLSACQADAECWSIYVEYSMRNCGTSVPLPPPPPTPTPTDAFLECCIPDSQDPSTWLVTEAQINALGVNPPYEWTDWQNTYPNQLEAICRAAVQSQIDSTNCTADCIAAYAGDLEAIANCMLSCMNSNDVRCGEEFDNAGFGAWNPSIPDIAVGDEPLGSGDLPVIPGLLQNDLAGWVSRAVNGFVFPIAGIILFAMILWGGFDIVLGSARGETNRIDQGKKRVTSAIIGFLILFAAFWIIQAVEQVFGLRATF
ncbi:MAG: pilin [Pseudomonadales bacterium]|nr:pilin [Pseudomonadales bacterium]